MNFFDIYTKLYVGFLSIEDFKKLVPSYDAEILNIFVTIEKINSSDFDIVYYVKNKNGKFMNCYCFQRCVTTERGMKFVELSWRLFMLAFYA